METLNFSILYGGAQIVIAILSTILAIAIGSGFGFLYWLVLVAGLVMCILAHHRRQQARVLQVPGERPLREVSERP